MANKYKNIVGTAFAPYVKDQLKQRKKLGLNQFKNKTPRTTKELQYYTNRNAFFRLSSSAQVTSEVPLKQVVADTVSTSIATPEGGFIGASGVGDANQVNAAAQTQANQINNEQEQIYNNSFNGDIAKNNVLQGGTIIAGDNNSTTLRKGFKNTYAEGSFDNLGLQPIPGITGITIGTGGKWQTLMQADIEFICYNLDQLDIMSKLYMSLGVTCFLEWGHVPYLNNSGNLVNNPTNINFFGEEDKLNLIKSITKKREETDGNYDAFLGTVYNFSYEADKDGAYLCKTQLMGSGGMVESLKINTSFNIDFSNTQDNNAAEKFTCTLDNALYTMSEFLSKGKIYEATKGLKYNSNDIRQFFGHSGVNESKTVNFGKVEKNEFFKNFLENTTAKKQGTIQNTKWGDLLTQIYGSATYSPFKFNEESESVVVYTPDNSPAKFGNAHQYITGLDETSLPPIPIDFYSGYAGMWDGTSPWYHLSNDNQVLTYITLGHLFALIQSLGIFVESKNSISTQKQVSPIIYIDYHPNNTMVDLGPITATINPYKVIVPFIENSKLYRDFFKGLNIAGDITYKEKTKNLSKKNLSRPNVNVPNRINQVLDPKTFKDEDVDKFGGRIMNSLINIDFARDCLRSTRDSENNVNLIEFISKILNGVNESLGGVNNLRPFIDECGLIVRIIDEKVVNKPALQENLVEIPTFGLGSTAYNASYNSAITPKLASQIVIATQALGSGGIKNFSEDVLSYQALNGNVKDRFSTFKYPAINIDPVVDESNNNAKKLESLVRLYEHIFAIYGAQFPNLSISNSICQAMTSPYIDKSRQTDKTDSDAGENKPKKEGNILIPLEYTITMDGISGILPYNAFTIPDERLPERYRGRVAFAVFSINHAFDNNNWTTTLRGQTIMLDTYKTPVSKVPPPKNFSESPEPEYVGNFNPEFPTNNQTTIKTTPGLNDSPRGQVTTVNNITPRGIDTGITTTSTSSTPTVTVNTLPDGRQSISLTPLNPRQSDQDINAAFTFIANNESNGVPDLKAYTDKDYTSAAITDLEVASYPFTYRIGFGSDTVTNTDGSVTKVVRSSRITAEQAELDLKRRIKDEFKPKVVRRLNERGVNYDNLPLEVKVVFLDLAYNYGTLFYDFINAWKNDGKSGIIAELNRRIARGESQVPSRRQKEINYLNG